MTESAKHRWTRDDDVVVFYIWKFGTARLPLSEAGIANLLGMSAASLYMRKRNFDHLAGTGGLAHVADQSKSVFDYYKLKPEADLRALVLAILQRAF